MMDENYDTFSYSNKVEQAVYERILDSGFSNIPTAPQLNYEDLNHVQAPQFNYEDVNDVQAQQLNYEELNEVQRTSPSFRELPQRGNSPIPDVPQRSLPPVPLPETSQKKPNRFPCGSIDSGTLYNIRKNLKKVELRSSNENPKPTFPIRLDVSSESDAPAIKPFLSKKPQIPSKPSQTNLANKTSLTTEKINTFNMKLTEGKDASSNVSSSFNNDNNNNNNNNNNNLENDSSDESQTEYVDAGDVKSLLYQPYFYETFNKSMENSIFNKNTEDGLFVIRKSRNQDTCHPYTMLVFHQRRAFRLKIRFEDYQYAIGEKKDDENKFDSVIDLVEYYEKTPLMLIGAGSTKLKVPTQNLKK